MMNHSNRVARSLVIGSLLMACGSSSHGEVKPVTPSETTVPPEDSGVASGPARSPIVPSSSPSSAIKGELWVDQYSHAANDARILKETNADDARRIQYIADQPMGQWLGEWSGNVEDFVRKSAMQSNGKILNFVLYNIPFRDCGSYSAGGTQPENYRQWVESVVRGLGSQKALLILEPDAIPQLDCLPPAAQSERLALLKDAVQILKKAPGAKVYVDAGHPAWKPTDVMAERLLQAGVMAADGFALNISNFQTLETNISYGRTLRSRLGKNFVIDTSRNGRGPDPDGVWCNPRSRALGRTPTLQTETEGVDAFLWVKRPGESDGSCNGGPGAGQWWREIALEMAREAGI
jgi:endoglucanase